MSEQIKLNCDEQLIAMSRENDELRKINKTFARTSKITDLEQAVVSAAVKWRECKATSGVFWEVNTEFKNAVDDLIAAREKVENG